MGAIAEGLASFFTPWIDLYASSALLETMVMFLHLGGMVAAGGMAFTLDRSVLRASREGGTDKGRLAEELHQSHGAVVIGLGVVMASGVALTVSDPTVFLESWIYWAKMVTVVLLLVNGLFLKNAGEGLLAAPDDAAAFHRLKVSAVRSGGLWALSILGGIAITMYA
jgi:hypothetical protein